ncbi:hypothetical protein [Paenibacillus sp. ACRRY]|uniref:hypothetical protein n=1 Tax=Paenibacillus sp. ACRRY TaxID=2918208 RepID=UPI001EF5DF81|nr:hypothetical protein [Paenibacillus sp. ACRRY]
MEPKGKESFYVPVSTEAFFKRCWEPGIKALELELISLFPDPGVDLDKKHLPKLLNELHLLKDWAETGRHLNENDSEHLINRISILQEKMHEAFLDENVIIFIG